MVLFPIYWLLLVDQVKMVLRDILVAAAVRDYAMTALISLIN